MAQNRLSPSSTISVTLDTGLSEKVQSVQWLESLLSVIFVQQQLYLKLVAVLITFNMRAEYICEIPQPSFIAIFRKFDSEVAYIKDYVFLPQWNRDLNCLVSIPVSSSSFSCFTNSVTLNTSIWDFGKYNAFLIMYWGSLSSPSFHLHLTVHVLDSAWPCPSIVATFVAEYWYQFPYKTLASVTNMNVGTVVTGNRWWIRIKTYTVAFIGALVYVEDNCVYSWLRGGTSDTNISCTTRDWGRLPIKNLF